MRITANFQELFVKSKTAPTQKIIRNKHLFYIFDSRSKQDYKWIQTTL